MLLIFLNHKVFWEVAKDWKMLLSNKLGYDVPMINTIPHGDDGDGDRGDVYIMFGLNDYRGPMPKFYVAVQLEQSICTDSQWFTEAYQKRLANAVAVWDYSLVNYQKLKNLNPHHYHYVPIWSCEAELNDIFDYEEWTSRPNDVLFLGSLNSKRAAIVDSLRQQKLQVEVVTNAWGTERLNKLRQSKFVINVHYYSSKSILETVRLSYLLSNGCLVVSEASDDPILDRDYSMYLFLIKDTSQLVPEIVRLCQSSPSCRSEIMAKQQHLSEYRKLKTQLPVEELPTQLTSFHQRKMTAHQIDNDGQLDNFVTNSQDIHSVDLDTNDGGIVLKLQPIMPDQLPPVSLITITRDRKHLFSLPIRNFIHFDYPEDKMEWIIVDDSSDPEQDLSTLFPIEDARIRYIKLGGLGVGIGKQRNLGVELAKYDLVLFMDDDDYYYPISVYARVSILLSYPQYRCVGVADLDVYDTVNHSSARFASPTLSEASMGFWKSFWQEQRFPEHDMPSLGEGFPFTKNRRSQLIKMPSCFNLIAITHGKNYTGERRRLLNHNADAMRGLDLETKLFLWKVFESKN